MRTRLLWPLWWTQGLDQASSARTCSLRTGAPTVYLDDVIVFSRTVGDHIRNFREVLLLLEKAGVSLKSSKCHLFQQEVEYLGHVVRPGQLLANQKNIKSLAQALPPRNQTELKSFLGMCNVYRRFIKDYAHISKPLTNQAHQQETPTRTPPAGCRPVDGLRVTQGALDVGPHSGAPPT